MPWCEELKVEGESKNARRSQRSQAARSTVCTSVPRYATLCTSSPAFLLLFLPSLYLSLLPISTKPVATHPPSLFLSIAMTIWYYFSCVGSTACRFSVPDLKPPEAEGDFHVIEATTTTKDPVTLPEKSLLSSSPRMRFAAEHNWVVPVNRDGSIWLLPMLELEDKPDASKDRKVKTHRTETFLVRVQRFPAKDDSPESSRSTSPSPAAARSSDVIDVASSLSKVSLSSGDDFSYDSDECVEIPLDKGSHSMDYLIAASRSLADKVNPSLSAEESAAVQNDFNNLKPSYGLEGNLMVNGAFKGSIRWTRYVDTLPKGDALPAWAVKADPRLQRQPPYWSASVEQQTFYHLAELGPEDRAHLWERLTDSRQGLPCIILEGNLAKFNQRSGLPHWLELTCSPLRLGQPAFLKLRPIPEGYACQPKCASAEASYLLNNYQIMIEQNGKSQVAVEPLAKVMDPSTDLSLALFGEIASIQGGPGNIIYSVSSPKKDVTETLYRVGIRLRDGGIRFALSTTSLGRTMTVPGRGEHMAAFSTFEELEPRSPKRSVLRELTLAIAVPPGLHDIILRVADAPRGKYRKVEYVLRRRGDTKAVGEEEWKPFVVGVVSKRDGWVVTYFCNLARISFGRRLLLRPPPGSKSFTDVAPIPMAPRVPSAAVYG